MVKVSIGDSNGSGIPVTISKDGYNYIVYISSDVTNCKLSYIHGAGQLVSFKAEELKEVFDALLINTKGCIILNTIQKTVFDFVNNTYPVYYQHAVPIGYHNGFQYHVCFKNTIRVNSNCRTPEVDKPVIDKAAIKQNLCTLLKSKKRKTDYVDEFINSL